MKDKISFENSVREKSRQLIEERKRAKRRALYTASSLCVCFLVVFGLFLTMPEMLSKNVAFDAAPEAAYDASVNQSGGRGDYDHVMDGKGNATPDDESKADLSPAITKSTYAAATSVATPYEPDTPVTTGKDTVTESPVSSTAEPTQTDTPTSIEALLRGHTTSASVYTSLLATNTKVEEDISALIDAVFAGEPQTEPSEEYTVKVVFSTIKGKFTYYLAEESIKDIAP